MVLRQSILGLDQMVMDHHHISRFTTPDIIIIIKLFLTDVMYNNGKTHIRFLRAYFMLNRVNEMLFQLRDQKHD